MGTAGMWDGSAGSCTACHRWATALDRARVGVRFEGPAQVMVHRLKYGGWQGLAAPMALHLLQPLEALGAGVLVPIPTTAWRERMRGYNQAERLAYALGEQSGRQVRSNLLKRPGGRSQIGLPGHQRWANLKGAFSLAESAHSEVRGACIVLVDDVLTTGSTASAAATLLERAGAARVRLIAFARAQPSETAGSQPDP